MLEWVEFKYPMKVLSFFLSFCPSHEDVIYKPTPDEELEGGIVVCVLFKFAHE